MNDTGSPYLRIPIHSPEAAVQHRADELNYQLGLALQALRTISRECPDPVSQDIATAALTKIAKAGKS